MLVDEFVLSKKLLRYEYRKLFCILIMIPEQEDNTSY